MSISMCFSLIKGDNLITEMDWTKHLIKGEHSWYLSQKAAHEICTHLSSSSSRKVWVELKNHGLKVHCKDSSDSHNFVSLHSSEMKRFLYKWTIPQLFVGDSSVSLFSKRFSIGITIRAAFCYSFITTNTNPINMSTESSCVKCTILLQHCTCLSTNCRHLFMFLNFHFLTIVYDCEPLVCKIKCAFL